MRVVRESVWWWLRCRPAAPFRVPFLVIGLILAALSACTIKSGASSVNEGDPADLPPVVTTGPVSGGTDPATSVTTAATTPTSGTVTADQAAPAVDPVGKFGLSPRSMPAAGSGTALLRSVRVGPQVGFERIVFEFEGSTRPAYRVRWVVGPVTADASGQAVSVAGSDHLEVILSPASGVDQARGTVVYRGPDRVAAADPDALVRELVRTGDFEAVLTWVIGAGGQVPFRVSTLSSPTRVVVDLRSG